MTATDGPFLPTYARYPLTLVRGEGRRVQDSEGRWYLDAIVGIAVNALGYGHPAVTQAVHAQVDALMHTSNLYHVPVQTRFAERLNEVLGGVGSFLCNSGTEANEAAIKLIRKHHWRVAGAVEGAPSPRTKILVATNAFHGRSLMALAMTPRPAYQAGFGPLPGPVEVMPTQDMAAAIDETTAAVFLEPVQGEGGCTVVPTATLQAIRDACDKHGALLVYDEIQCGLGRTGEIQHHPRPDIMTVAKAVGGGLPLGAMVVIQPALADTLRYGDHGSTFGGNPVACAAGVAVLDTIVNENMPARCALLGARLQAGLAATGMTTRGAGLIVAAETNGPAGPVVDAMRAAGVLVCPAGPTAIRFVPAFTTTEDEIDEIIAAFATALATCGRTAS